MGRKVSYDEKIEIVKWVLKHNHDYKQAAQKFDITYSRAYAWTQKYEQANDWTALKDRRGKARGRQPADREKPQSKSLTKPLRLVEPLQKWSIRIVERHIRPPITTKLSVRRR